mmetsp:Transcript_27166/g.80589  ORF Transcript_27166/g.80589 Transcript_27166/m.80589 type:complete len:258 (+) Transcript_27166:1494-2267(+)
MRSCSARMHSRCCTQCGLRSAAAAGPSLSAASMCGEPTSLYQPLMQQAACAAIDKSRDPGGSDSARDTSTTSSQTSASRRSCAARASSLYVHTGSRCSRPDVCGSPVTSHAPRARAQADAASTSHRALPTAFRSCCSCCCADGCCDGCACSCCCPPCPVRCCWRCCCCCSSISRGRCCCRLTCRRPLMGAGGDGSLAAAAASGSRSHGKGDTAAGMRSGSDSTIAPSTSASATSPTETTHPNCSSCAWKYALSVLGT